MFIKQIKMKNLYLLIILCFLFSCSSHNHKNEEQNHNHNHIVLSLYSDDYELFAEVDPFVIGHSSDVLVYITQLSDFKPLTDANVSVKLIDSSNNEMVVDVENHSSGVWSFEVKPENQNILKIIFDIEKENKKSQLVSNPLKIFVNDDEVHHEIEEHYEFSKSAVVFPKEQSWKIDFRTEKVNYGNFGSVIKSVGKVMPSTDDEVFIIAKSRGTLVWNTSNLFAGREVEKNEHLYTVLSHGFADENSSLKYFEAENNFKKFDNEYNRAKLLIKDKIISVKEFEETKTEYENAKAIFGKYKNSFSKNGEIITSNSTGLLKDVFVKNGEFVESGTVIASIIKNSEFLIQVDVDPKYSNSLKNISSANFKSLDKNSVFSLEELGGELVSVGRSLNLDNFLLPIFFKIKNNSSFVSGSFVEIFIKTSSNKDVIYIPITSLIEEQGNYFVYKQIHPALFEKSEVKVGDKDGVFVEVLDGLSPLDRVVTKGATILKLTESSGELDPHAGHIH